MTYVADWTCPGCDVTRRVLHYHDTAAPVVRCSCGWQLPHETAMARIRAYNRVLAAEVLAGAVLGDRRVAYRLMGD